MGSDPCRGKETREGTLPALTKNAFVLTAPGWLLAARAVFLSCLSCLSCASATSRRTCCWPCPDAEAPFFLLQGALLCAPAPAAGVDCCISFAEGASFPLDVDFSLSSRPLSFSLPLHLTALCPGAGAVASSSLPLSLSLSFPIFFLSHRLRLSPTVSFLSLTN